VRMSGMDILFALTRTPEPLTGPVIGFLSVTANV
jgi:hypothetical protein